MKRLALISIAFVFLTSAVAVSAEPQGEADLVLNLFLPQCAGGNLKSEPFGGKLPSGMTAEILSYDSEDHACQFDSVRVKTGDGRYWVGNPWPIAGLSGTPAERIKNLAWNALQRSVVVEPGATEFGMQKVRLYQVTEAGRIPSDGVVDPAGTMFFPGDFARNAAELKAKIDARLAPVIAASPSRGPKDAKVTIIEFSDFQCPSCMKASEFFEPFFEKHADSIRHIRVDMPIVSSHPWAFSAALIGRAIWRQNPELFWKYKLAVYKSQSDLSAFTIDQFGRGFAEDNGLDMRRFDADVMSDELRKQLLETLGVTFTIQIAATPTYSVNGTYVATGADGSYLKAYVEKLLAAQ